MTSEKILIWILLGLGGGITYGRWRSDRARARKAADDAWAKRKDKDYLGHKRWRRWY